MFRNHNVAIAIPCFNEESNLPNVVAGLPEWVDTVIIVDDASTDGTAAVAQRLISHDSRISVINHPKNLGVGAAIASAMMVLRESRTDVAVVMAGDNQMDPALLPALIEPIVEGTCDYTKTNRLLNIATVDQIPLIRYVGNSFLSFFTKLASGLWMIGDSQSGYCAANRRVLQAVNWGSLYPRYGYPNQLLVTLSILRFCVGDLATQPRYNVGEQSKLRIRRVLFTIPLILLKGFFRRIVQKHVLNDQHPLVVFYFLSIVSTVVSFVLLIRMVAHVISDGFFPPVTTVSFVVANLATLFTFGLGMWMDIDSNRSNSLQINRGMLVDVDVTSRG